MAQGSSSPNRTGFQGAIGNLPLVDLLQVWSSNGFSGLVLVTSQSQTGHLYFVDGQIVHAECEDATGEQAVGQIVSWPEGSFELHPNTTTIHRTIQKSLSHLLLDAHRHLDERRRETPAPAQRPPPPAPRPPPLAASAATPPAAREPARPGPLEQIRAIRGVTQVVRFGVDGRPIGERSAEGEALAAKGLYLALTHATFVAEAFGLHELSVGVLHGARESFVLVRAGGQHLCVAVAPDVAVEPVAAQIRALLTRPAPRPQ